MKLEYTLNLQDYLDANQGIIRSRTLSYIFQFILSFLCLLLCIYIIVSMLKEGIWSGFEIQKISRILIPTIIYTLPLIFFSILFFPLLKFNPVYKIIISNFWSKQLNEHELKSL